MTGIGLGVDIEQVGRFRVLCRNRRFLRRVFSDAEVAYCLSRKNRAQHFAVRFAAKEAVWKALSDVIRRTKCGISHKDVWVRNLSSGKPEVVLPRPLARWARRIEISLSHTDDYAVAVAVVRR